MYFSRSGYTPRGWCLWAVLGVAAHAAAAVAQQGPPPVPTGVRADLQPLRPVFLTELPVLVRFTLTNTTDQPIDLPLPFPTGKEDGAGLPLALVLGADNSRTLIIRYEGEPARELSSPPALARPSEGARVLRIAPFGVLGAELDLRRYHGQVRYAGTFRLEWRPLDGQLGVRSAEFRVEARQDAVLVTDRPGKITFALEYEHAPRNVENFVELVREGFYQNKTFHRIVPGFVLQGGCPRGDGTGMRPDGRTVPAEFTDALVEPGTLLMARKPSDPDSASCQFFVALARLPDLDGQYTIIGRARDEESLRVIQELAHTPTDRRDRPLTPVVIRSISLVAAADDGRPRELDSGSKAAASRSGHGAGDASTASRPAALSPGAANPREQLVR